MYQASDTHTAGTNKLNQLPQQSKCIYKKNPLMDIIICYCPLVELIKSRIVKMCSKILSTCLTFTLVIGPKYMVSVVLCVSWPYTYI